MMLKKKKNVTFQLPPAELPQSNEWRRSPELTSAIKKYLSLPEMLGAIYLLRRESPKQLIHLPLNAPENEQLRLASMEDGYYLCLNKLLSLAEIDESQPEIEATFE